MGIIPVIYLLMWTFRNYPVFVSEIYTSGFSIVTPVAILMKIVWFFFFPSHSLLEYLPSCQSNPAPIHTLSSFDQAKNLDSQRVNQRGQIIKMMAMVVINRARWHSGKNFDRNQVELILNVYKACWLSEF